MGNSCKAGKKGKTGDEISFGDGLLKGEVIDVVDEGNRLIRFEYDGIFEEILEPARPDAASAVYYSSAER